MRASILRSLLAVLAVVSLLGVASASAGDGPVACTLIGCESAVTIDLSSMPPAAAKAQVCVDGRCGRSHRLAREAGADRLTMRLTRCQRQAGRRVTVGVRVYDRERELVMRDRIRAKVTRAQPNGPNCPPVCFIASLKLRGDTGRLAPKRFSRV